MRVKLKVILSDGHSYDWSHMGTAVSIGRDPACELAVEDSQDRHASWMHARIEWDGSSFLVRDFQSKNGTYVNDDLIDGVQPLKVGDTIRLGRKGPKLIALELDPGEAEASPGLPPDVSDSGRADDFMEGTNQWGPRAQQWLAVGVLGVAVVASVMLIVGTWGRRGPIVRKAKPRAAEATAVASNAGPSVADPPLASASEGANRTVPPPPPPPTPAPAPPAPQAFTPDELAEQYAGAIVWLGAELKGFRLPLCSGFAIDRTKIISTAQEIAQLKGYYQEGKPVFVYCDKCSSEFVRVVDLRVHPAYDEKNPTSPKSLRHNVGIVTIESPLPKSVVLQMSHDLPKPLAGMEIMVVGYSIQYEPKLKPYDPLAPPKLVWSKGRVRDTKQLAGGGKELPLLELDIATPDGTAGAPVFSSAGKVVGVLLRYGEERCAVLADQLSELSR
jgi:hypothetical protein